jgi:hypothetical protein
MLALNSVRRIAENEGYEEIYVNDTSKVISFARDGIRINVYWTTGTVGTCLMHPRQGKTQLFRRNADVELLRQVFRNPRVHSGSGYHRVLQQQQQQQLHHLKQDENPHPNKRRRIDNGHTTTGSNSFSPGDRVYVSGYAEATVRSGVLPMGSSNYPGRIKVEYDDGTTFHVAPNQLVPPVR